MSNRIPNEDIIRMAEKEEPRFLSIILRDKDSLMDAISCGIVPSEKGNAGHFLIDKNNLLYTIIRNNFNKYGTLLTRSAVDSIVDMMNVGSEEEKASIKSHWDKVWNRHDAVVEDYAILKEHINDRFILWQFYNLWKDGDKIIRSNNDHSNLVKTFVSDLNAIKNISPDSYSKTVSINEGLDNALKYMENKRLNPDSDELIKCGIDGIDNILHGFARGSYTVISGMINGGKTTLLMNIAFNMAKAGYNVAYVSLEKDANLFFRRTLACHALTDYNRMKIGGTGAKGLSNYWYEKLKLAALDLKERIKPNYHCLQYVQNTKLTKILADLDKLRSRRKLDAIFIDYLQVIGTETVTVGRPDLDLANVHKRIMAYGRELNTVNFTALQLKSASSKEIRKAASKVVTEAQMATLSVNTEDFGGSQMVVADADNALSAVLNGDKPPTKMFISFTKARDDESRRTIPLDFDGKIGRVCDPEYGATQIQAVDDVLFDKKITEEQLDDEANFFAMAEVNEKSKGKVKETNSAVINKSVDLDLDLDLDNKKELENTSPITEVKVEPKVEKSEPKKRGDDLTEVEIKNSDKDELFDLG